MGKKLKPRGMYALLLALVPWVATTSRPMRAQDSVTGLPPVFSPSRQPDDKPAPTAPRRADIRVLSNLVVTPVTVIDPDGEFVYDLTEKDFEIFDNGAPQHLESFESEARPVGLVIVIQTSRSVEPLLEQVRPLGSVFSSLVLGPQGQAAVLTFNDRVHVAQDFSDDSDQLATTLRRIAPEGVGSRLNDALMRGVALLERRPKTERRIIVAFSDGYDSGSETDTKEVIRRATGSEVTIYGLGFNPAQGLLSRRPELSGPGPLDANVTRPLPPGGVPTPTASANVYDAPIPIVDILTATGEVVRSTVFSSLLEYYAGYTGGVFYKHWKKKVVEDQLSRIATEIHSQYELAYVPDTLTQGGFHKIEVKVHRPRLKVRARAGYFYQAPATPAASPTAQPSDRPQ
ncbi:MAG: VWA domain-containing protein [Acidobacteriia bacterium]|nr:VWA domain-containing protein [Terriglobia bacterium]